MHRSSRNSRKATQGGGPSMIMKRLGSGMVLRLVSIILLVSLYYALPSGAASSVAKGAFWGFVGTPLLIVLGVGIFLLTRVRKGKAVAKKGEVVVTPPSHGLGDAFFDAITYPFTWIYWVLMFWVAWRYSNNLLIEPNWTWVPLFLWALFVLFARARAYSKERNGGKEKKA